MWQEMGFLIKRKVLDGITFKELTPLPYFIVL